jgi:hypothetical protein
MGEKDLVTVAETLPTTTDVLGETVQGLIEGLTGLATSDKKDIIRSVGFIFQRWRTVRLLDAFRAEWNRFRAEGRIAPEHESTEQHAECLQELLDFLDKEQPDQLRFDALKKILLVSATEKYSSRDSVLPQQFMKLIRELSSGEVLVLLSTYRVAKKRNAPLTVGAAREWLAIIAEDSGLKHSELVTTHERKLMEKYLIEPRDRGGRADIIVPTKYWRLTGLGYDLCEYIAHFPEQENPK